MIETADTNYDTDYERPIMSRYFDRKSEKNCADYIFLPIQQIVLIIGTDYAYGRCIGTALMYIHAYIYIQTYTQHSSTHLVRSQEVRFISKNTGSGVPM